MENAGKINLPVCTNPSCRRPFPVGTSTCPDCGQATEERPLRSLQHLIPSEFADIMESLVRRSPQMVAETSAPLATPLA